MTRSFLGAEMYGFAGFRLWGLGLIVQGIGFRVCSLGLHMSEYPLNPKL